MKSGIYIIRNIVNNKVYVGYTRNFYYRKNDHFKKLKINKHDNQRLQNSYNKYGKENFVFEELVECDPKFLTSEENYWCNLLNSHNDKFGYNIQPTGPNKYPIKHNYESIRKMSESQKKRWIGKTLSEEHKLKLSISRKKVGISEEGRRKINEGTAKRRGSKMSEDQKIKISNTLKGRNKLPIEKLKRKPPKRYGVKRPILQYDLDGKFIKEWNYINEVEKFGFISDSVIKVCKGRQKHHKKYIWKYKDGYIREKL